MLVRISEIEIVPENLEDYKAILIEEANASVHLEKGVISIFPMFQKEHPNHIRILEIYGTAMPMDRIKSPDFQVSKPQRKW